MAFDGCTSLEDITIPDGVTEIGGAAFEKCTNIKSITIPYSVTTMGGSVFEYWDLKQTIIIEGRTEAPDTWGVMSGASYPWDYLCEADIVWDA